MLKLSRTEILCLATFAVGAVLSLVFEDSGLYRILFMWVALGGGGGFVVIRRRRNAERRRVGKDVFD